MCLFPKINSKNNLAKCSEVDLDLRWFSQSDITKVKDELCVYSVDCVDNI